ncbi:MAG: nucleoside deaminase [Bernardetiaceae bacterium]|jgi:tRNA(Arg) A34 adenosine deaminase TadA|nr:nucleoside deaminase [Bernardetiaceae bacterium]
MLPTPPALALEFMAEAVRLSIANVASGQGGPFGAVVVQAGRIIARGQNRVLADRDPTAHAEVVAIRLACQVLGHFQLTDCELYTSCEPCPMCLGAIYWARPSHIYYANTQHQAAAIGFDDHFIYQELARALPDRHLPTIHLPHPQAPEAFALWQAKTDKTEY